MRRCSLGPWVAICLTLWLCGAPRLARAGVYNIHLHTDSSPDFTDRASFLQSVLSPWSTSEDSAAALWRWTVRLKHQAPPTLEDGRGLWDPILFFNSYGGLHCGYVSAILQSLWDGVGGPWRNTYVELGGHTVAEVSWDGGARWHMFDASMNFYCRRHDGEVASSQEITAADQCPLSETLGATHPEPGHYYLYHFAGGTGTNPVDAAHPDNLDAWGFRGLTDNPVANTRTLRSGAQAFLDGVGRQTLWTHLRTGWRYRLNLRPWESYTRYSTSFGDSPDEYRPDATGQNPDLYGSDDILGGNFRANGRWILAPDLSSPDYRRAVYDEEGVMSRKDVSGAGPALQAARPGRAGQVTFKVYGANVVTSGRIELSGVRATGLDSVQVLLSRDGGRHWRPVGAITATGAFTTSVALPATLVGGAYEYLVRVRLLAAGASVDCGLETLRITTVTQLNPRALPRLARGRNTVTFRLGEQLESETLWPPLHREGDSLRFTEAADSWSGVTAGTSPDAFYDAVLVPLEADAPGQVTWKFQLPGDIHSFEYGGSFHTRYDDARDYVALQHSFDGFTFQEDARFRGGSSTLDGRLVATVASLPPGRRQVWLRYALSCRHAAAWNSTGVQSALLTVNYAPREAAFEPVDITWCWTEHRSGGDVVRTHRRRVVRPEEAWEIDVGGYRDPTLNWVRTALADYDTGETAQTYGYSDGVQVGTGADYDKKRYLFDWLDNAAFRRPYTVSRPAQAMNPDTGGGELTNGGIIPPTDYPDGGAADLTALWPPGAPVEVVVDLGAVESLQAVRITTHQPHAAFVHPDSIEVALSDEGVLFQSAGVIRHDDLWNPPGDFLDFEMHDSVQFAQLPAGGRLAYSFWLIPEGGVSGRYLRCRFFPQAGRGLSLSEIQALREIQVMEWPDREVGPPPAVSGVPAEPPSVARAGPAGDGFTAFEATPNPSGGPVVMFVGLARAQSVEVDIFDVQGRRVRRLAAGALPAGRNRLEWDGRDLAGQRVVSGVYLLRLRGIDGEASRRLIRLP